MEFPHGGNLQIEIAGKVYVVPCIACAEREEKIGDLEATVGFKDKEVVYLKRALESVYSRFRSREESREAEVDAELIANRAIESITEKDEEISRLNLLVEDLRKK